MNHLTNFYKNKAEQLQEKIKKLEESLVLHEKYREFDVVPEFQNFLYPPAWYINRGLPNPWDAMDPKTRIKEWRRHLEFWSNRQGTNPGSQPGTPNIPNLPKFSPSPAERSAMQATISNFMGEQTLHESDSMQVAGMADAPATYVPPFHQVAGIADFGMNKSYIPGARWTGFGMNKSYAPTPPPGAPSAWIKRWNYLFRNWNNWDPTVGFLGRYYSSPGEALGWLMGLWGNPLFGTWG